MPLQTMSSQFTSFFNFSATQHHPQFPVPQREWRLGAGAPVWQPYRIREQSCVPCSAGHALAA